MNKYEFLAQLRRQLQDVPEKEARASVDYYAEMIDDRMEEGLPEEEAVAAVGNVNEIACNILGEMPTIQKQSRKMRWWEIVLLALGAPIWIALLIAAAAVVLGVLVSLWSAVISLYAVAVSLGVSCIGCLAVGFVTIKTPGAVFAAVGVALVCAGLAILVFILSNLAAKGMVALTKLTWKGVKRCFIRKEQRV